MNIICIQLYRIQTKHLIRWSADELASFAKKTSNAQRKENASPGKKLKDKVFARILDKITF